MTPEEITDAAIAQGAAQKADELVGLVALVAEHKPRAVLEIGTMSGGTLRAWCKCATDDAWVVSIDLPGGAWGGGYAEHDIPRLESFAKPGQTLTLIRGDSHDEEIAERARPAAPYDFLFIDGDHTHQGVTEDFDTYSRMVRPGGLIAFHDIIPHTKVPGCDVDAFWEQIVDAYEERWEFKTYEDKRFGPWGGIGVMRMP